jgi:ABC-2 type transport system permease protein
VFGAIVLKELRELITPQALAPMLVVVVLYGFLGRAIRGERAAQSGPEPLLVVDRDGSKLSGQVRDLLDGSAFVVMVAADTAAAFAEARKGDVDWVLVLPSGLGDSLAGQRRAEIEVYGIVRGFALSRMVKGARVAAALQAVNSGLARERLAEVAPGDDPGRLMRPLDVRQFVVVRDRAAPGTPEQLAEVVMAQTFFIPMVLLLLLIMASQMIASSVGQEKENKTLETLLTVPVNRMTIVLGKMLGAVLFALLASALVFVALFYFMGAMSGGSLGGARVLADLGLGQGIGTWLLQGVALFLALVCALAVVSVLAVFADDARTAQLATTPVMILVLLPYMVTLFLDLGAAALPLRMLIYAIPFSYPFLVQRAAMFGDYRLIVFGIAYMALFAGLMVFVAGRLYSSDRILTVRLSFRRR